MKDIPVSRLAEIRQSHNLTQQELAEALGVSVSTISNWEQGRNALFWFEKIRCLCSILNCTPDDLIEYISLDELNKREENQKKRKRSKKQAKRKKR